MERGDLATEIGISVDQDACRCGLGKRLLLAALELAMRWEWFGPMRSFAPTALRRFGLIQKTYRSRPRGGGSNLLL
jgi:hypothetical protein